MNQQVRAGRGVNGTIVVLGAWCPTCQQEVTPREDGTCCWCQRAVVDEDTLPARELLEQLGVLSGRDVEGLGSAGAPDDAPSRPESTSKPFGYWTRERIVSALQAWAAERGYPPTSQDWQESARDHPTASWVKKAFGGSWAAAVEAAGFQRPRPGVRRVKPSGGAVGVHDVPEPAPPEVGLPMLRAAAFVGLAAFFDFLEAT